MFYTAGLIKGSPNYQWIRWLCVMWNGSYWWTHRELSPGSQLYAVFPLHDAAQFNSKRYWYFTQFHVYCNFPPIQMGFILDTPGGHQFTFEIRSSANNQRNICTLSIDHGVVLSRSLELVVIVQDVCQISYDSSDFNQSNTTLCLNDWIGWLPLTPNIHTSPFPKQRDIAAN